MDVIAHLLWTFLLFHRYAWWWQAALLGFLVDAIPYLTGKGLTLAGWKSAAKTWNILYQMTHSLLSVAVIALLLWPLLSFWKPLFGWFFHILLDIPTHPKEHFPTPFLWPLSERRIDGWDGRQAVIIATNYALLTIGYCFLIL